MNDLFFLFLGFIFLFIGCIIISNVISNIFITIGFIFLIISLFLDNEILSQNKTGG